MLERYADFEYPLAAAQLLFMSLGMGATLYVRDFIEIFRSPRGILHGLAAQLLLVPFLAWLFLPAVRHAPGAAAGLLLVAAMPGGSISNLITFWAMGNVALSIALTAVSTLASVATVPLLLRVLGGEWLSGQIDMPVGTIVTEVFGYLLAPLTAGMLIARFAPQYAKRTSVLAIRMGILVFSFIFFGSLLSGRIEVGAYGWSVPSWLIVFAVVAQQLGMLPGRLLGFPTADNAAVGIEVTVRNVNLALLLKATLFPASAGGPDPIGDGVLYVVLFYGAASLGASIPMIFIHRWRRKRQLRRANGA